VSLYSPQETFRSLIIDRIFQGLAPSFLSNLSDTLGRRPVLVISLIIYTLACIATALAPTYPLLLVFRAIQAIGGSPSIATGAGIISDIATPQERGKYMGLFQGMALFGPAFGPVLGGILVQFLDWRWIFWILAIWCGSNLMVVIL
jgi:multidrug resistance protein